MSQPSQKRSTSQPRQPRPSRRRLRFIAAVRFTDGRRQCFSVDNAGDHDTARRMVLDELEAVAAVVISDYR